MCIDSSKKFFQLSDKCALVEGEIYHANGWTIARGKDDIPFPAYMVSEFNGGAFYTGRFMPLSDNSDDTEISKFSSKPENATL